MTTTQWQPDWATSPGDHLAEYLEERSLSQADFARIAGLTRKHVNTLLKGSNPITPDTAIKLERVLGLKADIWLGIQSKWDLHQARARQRDEEAAAWVKRFPLRELKKLGIIPDTKEVSPLIDGILRLLGIGTPDAFEARVGALAVNHRRARAGQTSREHEICWLMLGEAQAREFEWPDFDVSRFQKACADIRGLTCLDPEDFGPRMHQHCRDAGVALVFQKPLPKTCLFGSARWIDGRLPMIQMSLRMRSNDHFWWTFFHEAAHIILHRGKNFADDHKASGDGLEEQADKWAEATLVGEERIRSFAASRPRSKAEVSTFAKSVGIHPGIVVGMLQHRGVIPHSHMNDLKVRFAWADEVESRLA